MFFITIYITPSILEIVNLKDQIMSLLLIIQVL